MASVYSFYQYDGTGVEGCFAYSGAFNCIWEGPITPLTNPWWTAFTGYYITPSLIEGAEAGFIWDLREDTRRYMRLFIRVKGAQESGHNEQFSLGISMSGTTSILGQDQSTFFVASTGSHESGLNPIVNWDVSYTGHFDSGIIDQPVMDLTVTGIHSGALYDVPALDCTFRPYLTSGLSDAPQFEVGFSGAFIGKEKEQISISMAMTSVSYDIYGLSLAESGTGNVGIDFFLARVLYRTDV